MAWPMYDIDDPVLAIETICSVLEKMSPTALEHWFALPDRFLRVSAGDTEMDHSKLNATGFLISSDAIRRIRHLRLRLQVTFCPNARVRVESGY